MRTSKPLTSLPPASTERVLLLKSRLRALTWIVIIGLVLSGLTALPLPQEIEWIARTAGLSGGSSPSPSGPLGLWLLRVRAALLEMDARYPFVFYGGDWLAFDHFMIALAFVGPLRDPARNVWLYEFGLLASAAVVPFAFVMGEVRGIPVFWRLIDCAFGAGAFVPFWFCRRYALELDRLRRNA